MKIGYLGAGTWAFCLAEQLAKKGHRVKMWDINEELINTLQKNRCHPKIPGYKASSHLHFTSDFEEIFDCDILVEGVTASGIRPVFEKVKGKIKKNCPIVLTSKGIEQKTGKLLPKVIEELLGEDCKSQIAVISGPSHAEEVIHEVPSSVSLACYEPSLSEKIQAVFQSPSFRLFPTNDVEGVAFGGAMKNIIAIACGISDGLGYGDNSKAALITLGLEEITSLAQALGFQEKTLYGLSGIGDLCVTCLSSLSRNYQFGYKLAMGRDSQTACQDVGAVVEGAYSCLSARELSKKLGVELAICEMIYKIINKQLSAKEAMQAFLERDLKNSFGFSDFSLKLK